MSQKESEEEDSKKAVTIPKKIKNRATIASSQGEVKAQLQAQESQIQELQNQSRAHELQFEEFQAQLKAKDLEHQELKAQMRAQLEGQLQILNKNE